VLAAANDDASIFAATAATATADLIFLIPWRSFLPGTSPGS
jgi:hypothetical protein